MNIKFDHIHYRSADLEKTRHFYVDIMEAVDLSPVRLLGTENLQFQLGGADLLFAPAGDNPPPIVANGDKIGVYHIALLVENCDEATEYYRARGAEVAVEPFDANDNIRASFLAAPDGMRVELKQVID